MVEYTEHLVLFLIAVVANWFSALAGGGAGLIQLPILIFMGLGDYLAHEYFHSFFILYIIICT